MLKNVLSHTESTDFILSRKGGLRSTSRIVWQWLLIRTGSRGISGAAEGTDYIV